MNRESGFTLIEIIVSLVLVGMMAAIAGMGIVTGTKGYLLAKENSHMAQKAQLAMARMQRELMELTDIAAGQVDPAFIIYDNTSGRHAIARDDTDNTIKMFDLALTATILPSMDQGDILVDNVNNFTLNYYRGLSNWNFGSDDINLLSAIQTDLALDRSDGSGDTVTFTTTVNPRNTNNYGGVPPTTTPYTAHNYSCFIATAAYGDFDPPTMLLFSLSIVAVVILNLIFLTQRHKGTKAQRLGGWEAGRLGQNKGNVLIGLIVTMMIFAALGAGMVAMTGTSTSSQVTANTTSKAYYLAESGFRYAASEYLNEGDTDTDGEIEDDRNLVLVNLDGSTFTFVNPDERFSLVIFPYYFVSSSSHNAGVTTLNTNFPGNIPDDFSIPLTGGRLRIGSGIYNYDDYDGVGTFTLATGLLEAISDNMNVLPVGIPSGGTMFNGGNLTLTDASFFPAITGKFMIDGIAYTYKTKNEDTLQNITDANDPDRVFSFSVDANTDAVLKPYLKIYSTGTVGQGDQAASRQIIYNVPIPDSPTEGVKVEFRDQFDNASSMSNWQSIPGWGTHTIDSGGLKVESTEAVTDAPKASLIGLNWSGTNANLASAHSLSGHFLSYDAQVKVGFVPPLTPGSWSDIDPNTNGPDGLPKYYTAGLSFRLDESNNSYGVSFLRGSSFTAPLPDNNDDAIVPHDQIPMIVLWQQINSGADRQWLAYTFGTNEFFDDMESVPPGPPSLPSGWSKVPIGSTWERTNATAYSGTLCLTNDLSGAPLTVESLETPAVNLSDAPSVVLTFWHKFNFNDAGDIGSVIVDGSTIESFSSSDPQDTWRREAMIIPVGNIQVEFHIETSGGSAACNWHIDDVTIHRGFPVNESTLLVRIKEAYEVRFTSGGNIPIEDGDIVRQSNGAYGTVIGKPILSEGDWASGNAVGIITLNKVSETNFQSVQALFVGGNDLATCQGFTARNNYIKVFYGDVNGYGTANDDPFDKERLGNPRNEIHWPPDEIAEWSAVSDFFTLVQWDSVNSVDIIESTDEPGVIVLGTENSLFTPDSGILSYARPELGLHTFGHGSTNVYFDDFGLLVEIAAGSGFLTPIQE